MSKRLILRSILFLVLLTGIACRFSSLGTVQPTQESIPTTGTLAVAITYTGQWYRETFGYEPDAPNIRHVVFALPADRYIELDSPGWVFTNLEFTPSPEPLAIRAEAVEYELFLPYLYDAPGGTVAIELNPGQYRVAVAFIAAAIPPSGDDNTLYPGITGGGASTEFQSVDIVAGETTQLSIELTDNNGWGYVVNHVVLR